MGCKKGGPKKGLIRFLLSVFLLVGLSQSWEIVPLDSIKAGGIYCGAFHKGKFVGGKIDTSLTGEDIGQIFTQDKCLPENRTAFEDSFLIWKVMPYQTWAKKRPTDSTYAKVRLKLSNAERRELRKLNRRQIQRAVVTERIKVKKARRERIRKN